MTHGQQIMGVGVQCQYPLSPVLTIETEVLKSNQPSLNFANKILLRLVYHYYQNMIYPDQTVKVAALQCVGPTI